jgi:hypothetical protein
MHIVMLSSACEFMLPKRRFGSGKIVNESEMTMTMTRKKASKTHAPQIEGLGRPKPTFQKACSEHVSALCSKNVLTPTKSNSKTPLEPSSEEPMPPNEDCRRSNQPLDA